MLLSKTCNPGYYCKPQRLWGTTSSRKEDSGLFFFFFFFIFKICWLHWEPSSLLPWEVWRLVNFSDGRTLKAWFPLSVLSLSFPLAQCVWERMRKKKKKPTQSEKERERFGVCVCWRERKTRKGELQWDAESKEKMDAALSHPPLFFCIVCHNESQGLHNPAQLLSTHLITNGD